MKSTIVFIIAVVLCSVVCPAVPGSSERSIIDVRRPIIVVFFPEPDVSDADTNEALADFQYYAKQVREPLKKSGVELQEVYTHSFRIRLRNKIMVFHPPREGAAYYFFAPGKKPHVEYGVMTDHDLLEKAQEYFGYPSK